MTGADFPEQLQQLAGIPVAELVLHRPPMLALGRLLDIGPGHASCELLPGQDNLFLVPGKGVPTYAGVEYMAQCTAAYGGACARLDGLPPAPGLLLGSRHYKASERYLDPELAYQVSCRELARNAQGMASFDCRIVLEGSVIAEARIAVLQNQQEEQING